MELLKAENVQILESATEWKDAVRKSTAPLEKGNFVTADYKEAIIKPKHLTIPAANAQKKLT